MNQSPLDDPIYVTTTGLKVTVGARKIADGSTGFHMAKDIKEYKIRFENDIPLYTNSNLTQEVKKELPLPEFLGSARNPQNSLSASESETKRLYKDNDDTPRTDLTVLIINEQGITVDKSESQLVWE